MLFGLGCEFWIQVCVWHEYFFISQYPCLEMCWTRVLLVIHIGLSRVYVHLRFLLTWEALCTLELCLFEFLLLSFFSFCRYCVAGTIGHKLMSGKPTKIDLDKDTQINVRCQVDSHLLKLKIFSFSSTFCFTFFELIFISAIYCI